MDVLLDAGITQEMLNVDIDVIKDVEKEEKEKKKTICPECHCEF